MRSYRLAAMAVIFSGQLAHAQTFPTDAQNPAPLSNCVVSQTTFNGFFQSGAPTLNGVVNPANSVAFPHNNNCDFYQWSEQMFLWVTSPAPPNYGGGGGRVFDSPVFYDVSPPDQNGNRVFIPHFGGLFSSGPGFNRVLSVRTSQAGPDGLPVIFDRAGRLVEVEPPQIGPTGKPLIRNKTGDLVEIERATIGADQRPLFQDKSGKTIEHQVGPADTRFRELETQPALKVQKFMIDGRPIFVDPFGSIVDIIDSEEGQAGGGGVQLTQSGSLVYYITMANDVYAWYVTMLNKNITPTTQFPTKQSDLNQIVAFAAQRGVTFPDPNALAVELKTSWVEAGNVPNLNSYVTITATVPTFDMSNSSRWVINGQKTVQLALMGIHIVGSAAGHPEMIWATFEHFGNTANAGYSYNAGNIQKSVPPDNPASSWLFAAANQPGTINTANMKFCSSTDNKSPCTPSPQGSISANSSAIKIVASNTVRTKAFGAASNLSPNPEDGSPAASNTEIIEINNSILKMMPNGDVRSNYFLMGATWTNGGAAPTKASPTSNGNQIGTSRLANSTMETFQQGPNNTTTNGSSNCFDCHNDSAAVANTDISHVFDALQPLPPFPPFPPFPPLR